MMRSFEIVVENKRKNPNSKITMPKRATKHSAGYDFYSPIDLVIMPKQTQMIWTDIKACFNQNEVLLLCVTSGMGKKGIMLANNVGVIDCDYYNNENNDGNLGFMLYNFSDSVYKINAGDKIGQGIFTTFLTVDNEAEIDTQRKGGFGSTDKQI